MYRVRSWKRHSPDDFDPPLTLNVPSDNTASPSGFNHGHKPIQLLIFLCLVTVCPIIDTDSE